MVPAALVRPREPLTLLSINSFRCFHNLDIVTTDPLQDDEFMMVPPHSGTTVSPHDLTAKRRTKSWIQEDWKRPDKKGLINGPISQPPTEQHWSHFTQIGKKKKTDHNQHKQITITSPHSPHPLFANRPKNIEYSSDKDHKEKRKRNQQISPVRHWFSPTTISQKPR